MVGWDSGRLAMILAVLDARADVALGGNDVYLNVAGGLRIQEPAADLAVAAALLSSLTNTPLPEGTVLFGEIGLGGEVRPVGQSAARLKEARKLGFAHALTPACSSRGDKAKGVPGLAVEEIATVADLSLRFESPNSAARQTG